MDSETKKTALIVDDDDDFLFQLRVQLENAGFAVLAAGSRTQAEELLERGRPDLAVLDLMMERFDDGFVLSHHIKKRWPGVPVILVTAVTGETGLRFDSSSAEERAWVGADAVLAKPVRFEQLQREIARLLG